MNILHSYISLIEGNAICSYNYFVNKEGKLLLLMEDVERRQQASAVAAPDSHTRGQAKSRGRAGTQHLQNRAGIAEEKEKKNIFNAPNVFNINLEKVNRNNCSLSL